MKKRWLAILTAVIVGSVSSAPGIVQAAAAQDQIHVQAASSSSSTTAETDSNGDGVTDNGFEYKSNGSGTVSITGYQGTATALTVPLQITATASSGTSTGSAATTTTTYDVTEIGGAAFAGKAGLTTVTMQGGSTGTGTGNSSSTTAVGLQKIGARAFYGCPALTTITIPATVTNIEDQAFSDCPALSALNVNAGNQYYVSNDGVLYKYVGYGQTSTGSYNTYTLVQYPSGKTGDSFSAPSAIANRLTAIGQGAFAGAQSLKSIVLPESVETIADAAFQNCSALTEMTIPDKVSTIPNNAFNGCSLLTTVTIPADVTRIGESAFENCYALTGVTLPEKLTAISTSTFKGCSSLTEITIPSSVTSIGSTAFAYCAALVKVTVPASVSTIGSNVFLGDSLTMYCHSGSQAATYASNNKISVVPTYTVKFLSDTGTQLSSQEVVNGSAAVAPAMPDRPGYKLTWSSSFSNVTSDLTITAVYTRAYTVTFRDVYRNKTSTVQVEYGKSAKAPSWTYGSYTLQWSRSFTNITADITVYAFWKDAKTGFVIDKDTKKPASVGTELTKGKATYKVTSANVQSPKVEYAASTDAEATTITIPATITVNGVKYKVTSLADEAFKDNAVITTVTLGSNVTSIGSKAFAHCKKLSKITIKSKKLSTVGSKAFYDVKKDATVYAYRSKLTSYQKKIKSSGIKKKTTIKLKAIS